MKSTNHNKMHLLNNAESGTAIKYVYLHSYINTTLDGSKPSAMGVFSSYRSVFDKRWQRRISDCLKDGLAF